MELNPYAAHVYFNRGNLYASLRKYKDAEEDYTRGTLCSDWLVIFLAGRRDGRVQGRKEGGGGGGGGMEGVISSPCI